MIRHCGKYQRQNQSSNYFHNVNLYDKSIINVNPNNYMPYNNIGNIYFRLKRYDLAVNYYTEAIKVFPKYAI